MFFKYCYTLSYSSAHRSPASNVNLASIIFVFTFECKLRKMEILRKRKFIIFICKLIVLNLKLLTPAGYLQPLYDPQTTNHDLTMNQIRSLILRGTGVKFLDIY